MALPHAALHFLALCHTSLHHATLPSSCHTTLLHVTMHPLLLDMHHMMQEIQAEMACTNAHLMELKHHDHQLCEKILVTHNSQSPTFMTNM
jgi:hypothetical protein